MQLDPRTSPRALRAEGRRALWRVQWLAFPVGNHASHPRFPDLGGESEGFARSGGGITPEFPASASKTARSGPVVGCRFAVLWYTSRSESLLSFWVGRMRCERVKILGSDPSL